MQQETFDPADAHDVLARHIATLARRVLLAVPGSDAERLTRQVEVANQIDAGIAHLDPRAVGAADQNRELRVLSTVDLFNEGVDLPMVGPWDRPRVG